MLVLAETIEDIDSKKAMVDISALVIQSTTHLNLRAVCRSRECCSLGRMGADSSMRVGASRAMRAGGMRIKDRQRLAGGDTRRI